MVASKTNTASTISPRPSPDIASLTLLFEGLARAIRYTAQKAPSRSPHARLCSQKNAACGA